MLFEIDDLWVSANGQPILKGVTLSVGDGETHAIFGPNGSGKSTLANVILGNPQYEVTRGSVLFKNEDITKLDPNERAERGIFYGFQHPETLPGVSVLNLLRQALAVRRNVEDLSMLEVRLELTDWMDKLDISEQFLERYFNEGFSGGEKKRHEILQMAMLQPDLAVLDETDSGLDIDALAVVCKGINLIREERPKMGTLMITHYSKVLSYLDVQTVHVLVDGRVVACGGTELATTIDADGFAAYMGTA